jgi:hypothetical protein
MNERVDQSRTTSKPTRTLAPTLRLMPPPNSLRFVPEIPEDIKELFRRLIAASNSLHRQ